jgi:hypothetical protein
VANITRQIGMVLALACAAAAGAAYVLWDDVPSRSSHGSRIFDIPGWDKLNPCSYLISFDGMRTLTFSARRGVRLSERGNPKDARPVAEKSGEWSYDQTRDRYSVTLENEATQYTLYAPPNSDVCILTSGTSTAANLQESWFGRRQLEYEQDAQ